MPPLARRTQNPPAVESNAKAKSWRCPPADSVRRRRGRSKRSESDCRSVANPEAVTVRNRSSSRATAAESAGGPPRGGPLLPRLCRGGLSRGGGVSAPAGSGEGRGGEEGRILVGAGPFKKKKS